MDIVVSDLLEAGLALVPVPRGAKGPIAKEWNLRSNCAYSPNDMARLANKNIGLAHAYCTPTPTCAIDIDNFRDSYRWLSEHNIDLKGLLLARGAVVTWSGKRNSLKLLYRLPAKVGALPSVQLQGLGKKMMLEFRCASTHGKTVQDILPPSIHPSGSTYKWLGDGDPLNIPPIPKSLLDLWFAHAKPILDWKEFNQTSAPPAVNPETPRELARVRTMLSCINANCSREVWLQVVWGLLSTRWTTALQIAKDWSKTAPDKFNEADFATLVASFDKDYRTSYTLATVVYYARLGGWGE